MVTKTKQKLCHVKQIFLYFSYFSAIFTSLGKYPSTGSRDNIILRMNLQIILKKVGQSHQKQISYKPSSNDY